MKELIKSWEVLAAKYLRQAEKSTNSYTIERLFALAEIYKLCADQLKRHFKDSENVKAAAPDLLEACQSMIDDWHSKKSNFHKSEPGYLRLARKAIHKATE